MIRLSQVTKDYVGASTFRALRDVGSFIVHVHDERVLVRAGWPHRPADLEAHARRPGVGPDPDQLAAIVDRDVAVEAPGARPVIRDAFAPDRQPRAQRRPSP